VGDVISGVSLSLFVWVYWALSPNQKREVLHWSF